MNMLVCQFTTIMFVVYATIQSVLHYRLNRKVNSNHNTAEQKKANE